MNTAEQKVALMKMLLDADAATTERFYQFLLQMNTGDSEFSKEEIKQFEAISAEFISSGNQGLSVEQAHAAIRKPRP